MDFHVEHKAPYPRERVFLAHRDEFASLALHLDEVKSVREQSRSRHADGTVVVKNNWQGSKMVVPLLFRALVPEEVLLWTDESRFDPRVWRCDWVITIPGLGPMADVSGSHTYLEDGAGCSIVLDGHFRFEPEKAPQVRLPPGTTLLVERAITSVIVGLLEKSAAAMVAHLDRSEAR